MRRTVLFLAGMLGVLVVGSAGPASARPLSDACNEINDPVYDGMYTQGGASNRTFFNGEAIHARATPPAAGSPLTVELLVGGTLVASKPFPETVFFRFLADTTTDVLWRTLPPLPDAATVTWSVSCRVPATSQTVSFSSSKDVTEQTVPVDEYRTRVTGVRNGTTVFDMTVDAPPGSPAVQNLEAQAAAAAGGSGCTVAPPSEVSSSRTLTGSTTTDSVLNIVESPSVITEMIGPDPDGVTILVGDLDTGGTPFLVRESTLNTNEHIHNHFEILRTTTNTFLNAEHRQVSGTCPSPPPPPGTCDGRTATIVGTAGNERIFGTPGPDVISGLGGNDEILGLGGDDVICGGTGNDRLVGGDGDDRLFGGTGYDRLIGGAGDDRLFGEQGNDQLFGGDTSNPLRSAGNDALSGGPETDACYAGRSTDSCEQVFGVP